MPDPTARRFAFLPCIAYGHALDASGLSCRDCGACCRDAGDGRVLVYAADLVRWKRVGPSADHIAAALVPGHFSELAFPATPAGACVHLGMPGHPNDCSIYEIRGDSCRSLEPGSNQCLSYRRDKGIDPPLG